MVAVSSIGQKGIEWIGKILVFNGSGWPSNLFLLHRYVLLQGDIGKPKY